MYKIEATILVHSWPKVQIIINTPVGVIEKTVHFETARTTFKESLNTALDIVFDSVETGYNPKFKKEKAK